MDDHNTTTPPIATEKVRSESAKKTFFLDLKENHRGRMVQVTERFGERRNCIVIPAEDLGEIIECLSRLREHEQRL